MYGDIEEMRPLTSEQLRTQAIVAPVSPAAPIVSSPRRAESPAASLYKSTSASGPQLLLDATQTLASEVMQTLSPRKSKDSDPLVKPRESRSSVGLMSFLPSYVTSLWSSSEGDKHDADGERVEVTKALQHGMPSSTPAPYSANNSASASYTSTDARSNAPLSSTRKLPPTYGGAYATSPYHIPRPSHVEISDFPSPSRTPYHPTSNRRRE